MSGWAFRESPLAASSLCLFVCFSVVFLESGKMNAERDALPEDTPDGNRASSDRKALSGTGGKSKPPPRAPESLFPEKGAHRKLLAVQSYQLPSEAERKRSLSQKKMATLDRNMKLCVQGSCRHGAVCQDKPPLRSSLKRKKYRGFFGLGRTRHSSDGGSGASRRRDSLRLSKSSRESLLSDDSSEGDLSPCRPTRHFFRSTSCIVTELHKGEDWERGAALLASSSLLLHSSSSTSNPHHHHHLSYFFSS